ncbi:MAG: preprotein translocase subunit YajC [Thermoleophilia bacterium]|nr:preprotein translocase subunit YajC [Thermoleophilia bacterium]
MEALIFIAVIVGLMWVLLLAPQRRRQRAQRDMLGGLEVGDEVLTAGGVYATVQAVRDDDLTVEIAPGTSVRLDKRAVALVLTGKDAEADEDVEAVLETTEDEEPTQAGRTSPR